MIEFVIENATNLALDLNETNNSGETPLSICRKNKNQRGCQIIEENIEENMKMIN